MADFLLQRFLVNKASKHLTKPFKKEDPHPSEQLNDEQREWALLADLAYKTDSNKKDSQFFRQNHLRNNKLDYKIDNDLSTDEHAVLIRPDGSAVIAYRGTASGDDIITDLALSAGHEAGTERFKNSEKVLNDVFTKHGSNVDLVGHSLGSSIARDLAKKYDLEAHLFNPGSSVSHIKDVIGSIKKDKGKEEKKRENKITTYTTSGFDPISFAGKLQTSSNDEHIVIDTGDRINTHTLSNFTGL